MRLSTVIFPFPNHSSYRWYPLAREGHIRCGTTCVITARILLYWKKVSLEDTTKMLTYNVNLNKTIRWEKWKKGPYLSVSQLLYCSSSASGVGEKSKCSGAYRNKKPRLLLSFHMIRNKTEIEVIWPGFHGEDPSSLSTIAMRRDLSYINNW